MLWLASESLLWLALAVFDFLISPRPSDIFVISHPSLLIYQSQTLHHTHIAREMAPRSLFFLAAALVLCLANAFMLPSPLPLRAGSSARVLSTEDMSFDFGGRAKGGMEMMRHGKRFKKLGLPADQRKALLRALTTEGKQRGSREKWREGGRERV